MFHEEEQKQFLPLEALCFHWQKVFDISTASEDTFQVNPSSLDINPDIKQGIDPV